ncbi:MAG: acetyl-CoA carboxylase carboxyltransferase subunit alpha [Sphaerochaetaceae bacterium]|jgi:acetyl-CoA carboxylase carboxyl transferase subunit beta|nr:acetyl-CoA carboxylase carboxyltransferase subunit alpha [Sphaerochaetaceae bacterium]NLO60595.1 acetyl-CoA carboxylase carboxyltransferase subunit alpha [Spirochaetales bacterium]MDD2405998.1 acetyl-CoA carboxylase carboxyltransferase subunit alpha [Sphaerochaetaceae bacterium]MDD3670007.1 acetyl-CoA carboxylase carboxyltransferase subunit alpha [Sphaerochaetaceae bacterium]MDD4259828.1 acetyl-CoA carboxylase carboxyltransferase subunit alpha [Sphaerochaetaceae bacterium]
MLREDNCPRCGHVIKGQALASEWGICNDCTHHLDIDPRQRITLLTDSDSFIEFAGELTSSNPIGIDGYAEKIAQNQKRSDLTDAVITGSCTIGSYKAILAVMSFRFMGGSMGSVVGEKITQAMFKGALEHTPVIICTASGGARMQEGIFSLMQMAKTSSAAALLDRLGIPLFIILTNPTTGGVTASFAMLGDVILAEPGALIGFAGPRVIEGTIGERLPAGFQTAQFQLERGFVDAIVDRRKLKETLAYLLGMHQYKKIKRTMRNVPKKEETQVISGEQGDLVSSVGTMENMVDVEAPSPSRSSWDRVLLARQQCRPGVDTYIKLICENFMELHGDRYYQDDPAMIGGIGTIGGYQVTIIGNRKGSNLKENVLRNYGMSNPEGYRKALRLAKQAEKFHRPVICFIDTPGAYPGLESEQRGIGEAIARNLKEFSMLKTPIICFITGEGGSGGALGIGIGDKLYMLENAVYSVITPEGYASILLRDPSRAKEAAEAMKITARDLKRFNIIHDIIEEVPEGAHANPAYTAQKIKDTILKDLAILCRKPADTLVRYRIKKIRGIGMGKYASSWWDPLLQIFRDVQNRVEH